MLAAVVKQRSEPSVNISCKILEVRDTDVSGYYVYQFVNESVY